MLSRRFVAVLLSLASRALGRSALRASGLALFRAGRRDRWKGVWKRHVGRSAS
jgi:hypothetical protein